MGFNIAGIAQLVEHFFCKEDVRGSIPRAGSKNFFYLLFQLFFWMET